MKLIKYASILGILIISLTGCTPSEKSPEQLINNNPIYNEQNKALYDNINKMLSKSSSLLLPGNSQEVAMINKVDLNNDNIDEIVVFEKNKNLDTDENKVGFMILNENHKGKYEKKAKLIDNGESIEYANFYDLDNDGCKEIIMTIKSYGKTNLHIYKYNNGYIENEYDLNPTWIMDKQNLTDMKIKVGYVDDDSKLDILMLNYDESRNRIYASIFNFNGFNKGISLIDYTSIENVKNISDLYITLGNVATQSKRNTIKGIILDIPTTKDNSYFTQILYLENNALKKAFKDDDKRLMKSYYIPSEDINNDKIIEIPIVNTTLNESIYTSKSSANISWYRWNGKSNNDSNILFTIQIYYNYEYNYKFLIPNNLANKINVEQDYNADNNVVFKFYYNDSETKSYKNIFTIATAPKNIVDDTKNVNLSTTASIILKETEKYNFILIIEDPNEFNKLNLTTEALRDYFSLIYE